MIKFGFGVPVGGQMANPEPLVALARRGEELGFHCLAVSDHVVIPKSISSKYPYSPTGELRTTGEFLEQLTTLSFLAAKTSKIRLLTSVMVLPHRPPLLAAKVMATIDVLSGGRLIAGVGVGWMREEFEALNLPPFQERGLVADEYIRIFKELWTKDDPRFQGRYFSFSEINFLPKPVQKPHPPIWVGGESPRAIKRAAELGNGWFPIPTNTSFPLKTPDQLQRAIEGLTEHAERNGRRLSELEIAYSVPEYRLTDGSVTGGKSEMFVGDGAKIAEDIRRLEKLGVTFLRFNFLGRNLEETMVRMDTFAKDVMSRVV